MTFDASKLVTLERHALGPRLYVFGRRTHECHFGLAVAAAAIACAVVRAPELLAAGLGLLAAWLVVKDWRDLHPATRDTAAWSLGLHRRPDGRPAPAARERVPALAAVGTAAVGVLNVASVMTGDLPAHARAVLALAPAGEVRLAHALALPGGLALVGVAWPLLRRRRGALYVAVALLAALGAINIIKSLDLGVAVLSWALAALLWRSRAAFCVQHDVPRMRHALARAVVVLGVTFLAAVAVVASAASHAAGPLPPADIPGAAFSLLTLSGGPAFHAPFRWLHDAFGILGGGALTVAAASVLAPLRPRAVVDALERHRAAALVRSHGSDSLSAFKLRRDLARRFSADGRAMAGYRIEAGALLVAGDPVGAPEALPGLVDDLVAFSRRHGLALGAVGASRAFADLGRRAGLRRVYLGDEAILATGAMDLSGGAMKSLRKAVNRLRRRGFTAELHTVGELDAATVGEIAAVAARWRHGATDRGFSMAHDALADDLLHDAVVVVARDERGAIRGFLHFVPVFGRPAATLAAMCRDDDTPNGLTDFLVVEAARLFTTRGVEELSLNFAAFGRWLRDPANVFERIAARLVRRADRWFQIERLLRFNSKFRPSWEPRYLLVAGAAQLPRVALAAMSVEGHLVVPRPWVRRSGQANDGLAAPQLAS